MLYMKKILFSLLLAAVSAFALDINTASAEEFVKVKGIGEKKAERIIAHSVQTGHQTRRASGHLQRDIFYESILA